MFTIGKLCANFCRASGVYTYKNETMTNGAYAGYTLNNVTFKNSDIHDSNFSNTTLNNFTIFVT